MKTLLVMDTKDYDDSLPEIKRVAIRGIIYHDNKLLMIESNIGDVKFPGGGVEIDKSDIETLLREVREKTGYQVLKDSIREYGQLEEKRHSFKDMIWHQINRYYFCQVGEEQGKPNYSDNEKKHGMKPVWITIEQSLAQIENAIATENINAWSCREYNVLKLLEKDLQ